MQSYIDIQFKFKYTFKKIALCQKTLKLENLVIGEAFIELDLLDLSKPTIGWYKLYKQNCVDDNFYDST